LQARNHAALIASGATQTLIPIATVPVAFQTCAFQFGAFQTNPCGTIAIDWFVPWPAIVRPQPRNHATLVSSGTFASTGLLSDPEITAIDKWFQRLSEPVRTKPYSLAGMISTVAVAPPAYFGPEITAIDKWFRPLKRTSSRTSLATMLHL
jgi:hypothetical protein